MDQNETDKLIIEQIRIYKKVLTTLQNEAHLENSIESFALCPDLFGKVHDAIAEFGIFSTYFYPDDGKHQKKWHKDSAFIVYQSEAFNSALRSYLEAGCGFYNVAFALLRLTQEIIIKGAFYQGIADRGLRQNAKELYSRKEGKKLIDRINSRVESDKDFHEELNLQSVAIYDEISKYINLPEYRIPFKVMIQQIFDWHLLEPIEDPVNSVYNLFTLLCSNVHVNPNNIDIGRRINLRGSDIFSNEPLKELLYDYLKTALKVIDQLLVIEINILKQNIEDEVRIQIKEKTQLIKEYGLLDSAKLINLL